MRAAWYDQQGPAAQVLRYGELPDPEPGPGEVRVRVRFSGVNPGDTKKRRGWAGSAMPYPRVIPHSDAAGVDRRRRPGRRPEPDRFASVGVRGTAVARVGTVIAAYATRVDRPDLPFWPMLFANITIRLLGSDDFPAAAKRQAAADLSTAAAAGALSIAIGTTVPLERIAQAHERVDAGTGERTLVSIGS